MEKINIVGELVLVLKSHSDWVRKCPNHLPAKNRRDEKFVFVDKNGFVIEIGKDVLEADIHDTFPIKVYRTIPVRTWALDKRREARCAAESMQCTNYCANPTDCRCKDPIGTFIENLPERKNFA
jgi:hypothetical protein